MDIGKKIKDARLAKGLTQEELGNIVGLQKSAIAKYENGRVVNIKRSTLQKLAKALGLRGSDLIMESEPPDTKKAAPEAGSGKSEAKMKLFDLAENCTEEEAERLVQMMELFLGKK